MLGGYMGRILWIDLSTGILTEQSLPEGLLTDFIGGYGVGARLLYARLRPRG